MRPENMATCTVRDSWSASIDTYMYHEVERKKKTSDSVIRQKPLHQQKNKKATGQHKKATDHFDYTTIADRLRTASWSNDTHPTGVVKPVYGIQTFPVTAKVVYVIKRTYI